MSLIQLVYVSSAAKELDPKELEAILEISVKNNQRSGLTGLLLYSSGSFMQAIEGEATEVDATYARILRDPRHRGSIVLHREPISAREFPDWSMGFRRLGRKDVAKNPRYAPLFEHGFEAHELAAQEGMARELLQQFIRQAR